MCNRIFRGASPLLALLAMVVPAVFAGPGELDVRFGTHGWRDLPEMDSIVAAVSLPDGSVVVTGYKWPSSSNVVNPHPDVKVSRIDPTGTTLWTRSAGNGYAGPVARLRSGRILVGLPSAESVGASAIIALLENGDVDTGFGDQGKITLAKSQIVSGAGNVTADVSFSSIREMADGSLLVGGAVSNDVIPGDWSPASQAVVFRLGTDGALLDTPRPADPLFQQRYAALAQPVGDGRSLVLAANGCCGGVRGLLLSRDASGALEEAPASHDSRLSLGNLAYDEANRRFYALGTWNSSPVLIATDATGAPDPSFGADGTGRVAFPLSSRESARLLVDEDGSVVTFRAQSDDANHDVPLRETPHAQFFVGRWNPTGLSDPGMDSNAPVPLADHEGSSTAWNFRVAPGTAGFAWAMAAAGSAETSYGPDTSGSSNKARLAKIQLGRDSGPGTLGFQIASIRVAEQGSAQRVRIVRSGGSSGAVGVRYAVTSSTGADDLKTTSGLLTWPDGDATSRTIEIAAQDDSLLEGEERYTFILLDPEGGVEITDVPLVATIEDDEALELLTATARSPKVIAGQPVEFVLRLERPVPGPVSVIALVGDSVDANGEWPQFSGVTNSRRVRQRMGWSPGDTGERVIRLQTDGDRDITHTVDLHLRLASAAGLVRQPTALGTAVMGAKATVAGGTLLPPVATGTGSGTQGGGGGIGAGALISLLLLFLRRRHAQPESAA